ncbi:hypothetical protein F5Y04DRAFT_242491 [Hypomontagnella monticulosa]|nr:hypothetical protein F5Y04DRAFT_242491 [Hypomontagnella monticulosa]
MKPIPSTWFDGEVRDKVTTERQSGIIQAYLKGYIGVEDTAMIAALAVRHPAISTGDLSQDVSQFWRFLVHIVSEWPSEHAKILNLLDHFRKIPSTKHSEAERMYWGEAYVAIVGDFELELYIPVFWDILQEYLGCKFSSLNL